MRRAGCSRPGRLLSAGQSHQGTLRHLKSQWSPSEDNVTGSSLLKPKRQPRQETPTWGPSQALAPWNGPVTRGQGLGRGGRTERGAPAAGGSWGTTAPLPRCSYSQRGAVLAV